MQVGQSATEAIHAQKVTFPCLHKLSWRKATGAHWEKTLSLRRHRPRSLELTLDPDLQSCEEQISISYSSRL